VSKSDEIDTDDIFDDFDEDEEVKPSKSSDNPKKKPDKKKTTKKVSKKVKDKKKDKKTPKKKKEDVKPIEKPEVTPELKELMPDLKESEDDEDDLFGDPDEPEVTASTDASTEADDLDFDTDDEPVTEQKEEIELAAEETKKQAEEALKPKKVGLKRKKRSRYAPPTDDELDELQNSDEPEWDDEEMGDDEDNTVYVYIGEKGSGKTTVPLTHDKSELPDGDIRKDTPTRICVVSLDKQSLKIVKKFRQALWDFHQEGQALVDLREKANDGEFESSKAFYKRSEQLAVVEEYRKSISEEEWGMIHTPYGVLQVKEIHCWNGVRYYVRDPPTSKLKSASVTFDYIKHLLDDVIAPLEPDYILIDSAGRLSWITEYTMRYRENKTHIEGFKNKNLWKLRNDFIDHIFDRAVDNSIVSPIFTLFFKMQQIKDKEEGITYEKQPAWVDRIKEESNMVIELEDELVKGERMWFGHCQSPKETGWRTNRVCVNTDMVGNGGVKNLLKKNEIWIPPHIDGGTSEDVF